MPRPCLILLECSMPPYQPSTRHGLCLSLVCILNVTTSFSLHQHGLLHDIHCRLQPLKKPSFIHAQVTKAFGGRCCYIHG